MTVLEKEKAEGLPPEQEPNPLIGEWEEYKAKHMLDSMDEILDEARTKPATKRSHPH